MVQPHTLLTPTPFQSLDWDSRFPLIAPQRRSLWLPQARSDPAPLLSEPPLCSSLAEKAQGWGQVGSHLWPGGRSTGLGQSTRPGRALGSWSKEKSGVKATNMQAHPTPQHAPGYTTTEPLTPGSHMQPGFKPSSLSCGQEMGIPLLVSLATWDDVLEGGAPGSRSTDESGLDRTLGCEGLRTKVPGPPPARALEDKGTFQAGDAVEGRGRCQARDAYGFLSQIAPTV